MLSFIKERPRSPLLSSHVVSTRVHVTHLPGLGSEIGGHGAGFRGCQSGDLQRFGQWQQRGLVRHQCGNKPQNPTPDTPLLKYGHVIHVLRNSKPENQNPKPLSPDTSHLSHMCHTEKTIFPSLICCHVIKMLEMRAYPSVRTWHPVFG